MLSTSAVSVISSSRRCGLRPVSARIATIRSPTAGSRNLATRNVESERHFRGPGASFDTCLAQELIAQLADQPEFFGNRYKLIRRHPSEFIAFPARQGLEANDAFTSERHQRLIKGNDRLR